jgi:hypothetical protein
MRPPKILNSQSRCHAVNPTSTAGGQATALYCTIPGIGNYNTTPHWCVCQRFTVSPVSPDTNKLAASLWWQAVREISQTSSVTFFKRSAHFIGHGSDRLLERR